MISDGHWLKFGQFRNSSQKCYPFPGLSVVFFFTAKLGNYRGHVSHSYIQLKAFLALILTEQECVSSSRPWLPGCWKLPVQCHIHVRGGIQPGSSSEGVCTMDKVIVLGSAGSQWIRTLTTSQKVPTDVKGWVKSWTVIQPVCLLFILAWENSYCRMHIQGDTQLQEAKRDSLKPP